MAIAEKLPPIDPLFMQKCPLCGRMNRMVIKGSFIRDGKAELHPDIGYSFCNCKCIFYTAWENVKIHTHSGFEHYEKPLEELRKIFNQIPDGYSLKFNLPDQFFCEWGTNPHAFEHWNPRFNHVIFDMYQFCEDAKEIGFEIISAKHEFDVNSLHPKTMEIIIRKP